MSSDDTAVTFACCRAGVAELLATNADFDVVERAIDTCTLSGDEKDALWVWASAARHADHRLFLRPQRGDAIPAPTGDRRLAAIFAGVGHD